MLRLESISKQVGTEPHLYPLDLSLLPGSINTVLGATRSGKTSLLRLMAGLDSPSKGSVWVGDRNVTGVRVRKRNVAMVYQQFINYPSLSVYENIASPLRLQRMDDSEIKRRVGEVADLLRLTALLDRLPGQLSGGQQQRTALARALAKGAELLLLDEPLVNLDYKLREELRQELVRLFHNKPTTVVYATTEPAEALQLGGHTAVLHEGRLLQFGKSIEVFRRPTSVAVARAFSDPPINVVAPPILGNARVAEAHSLGIRPHDLHVARHHAQEVAIECRVELAEISGSDTYLHVAQGGAALVAQLRGVHDFRIGAPCTLYFDPAQALGFDARGELEFAPEPN